MRTLSVGSQGKNSYSIFPLSGPKDAGEKETPYPKTSTYLVPLLNETGLKVEKKKKKVLLLPQHCFPKQQNHFYVKYIQKTDSIDCDRETSTMKRFLPDSFQMKRKKKSRRNQQKDFRTEDVNHFSLLASIFKTPIAPPS